MINKIQNPISRHGILLVVLLLNMGCQPNAPPQQSVHAPETSEPLPHSESLRFDPERCEDNDGYAYIALGRVVVRVPYDRGPLARYLASETRHQLPVPPDRASPEGCRGRPSPAIELNLTGYQTVVLEGRFSDANAPLTRLSVNWLDTNRSFLQEANEVFANTLRREKKCVSIRGQHLDACSRNSRSIIYITRAEYGSAPRGRPLVVVCGTGTVLSENDCQVSYRLQDEIALNYRFDRRGVPPDRIIEMDQAVRSGVLVMIDSSFVWPES